MVMNKSKDGWITMTLKATSDPVTLTSSLGVDGGRGAVQLGADDTHDTGAHRLRLHGRQRGHLRHLSTQPRHRAAVLHEPQPTDRTDRFVDHRLTAFRRRPQRRPDGVPDQPRALSQNTLPARHVRADHFR